jgi:hypothetical protein
MDGVHLARSRKAKAPTASQSAPAAIRAAKGQENAVKISGKPGEFAITPELRRIWVRVRKAWVTSYPAFTYSLSSLSTGQADLLYGLVRRALFRGSAGEIVHADSMMREFMRSDDDRMCMIDVYEILSWRLGRQEALPPDVRVRQRMKGRIGRDSISLTP